MSTYRIRPLAWDERGKSDDRTAIARCLPFTASYEVFLSVDSVWMWRFSMTGEKYQYANSYEAAKQAAQQDWERRLGEVLEVVEESAR